MCQLVEFAGDKKREGSSIMGSATHQFQHGREIRLLPMSLQCLLWKALFTAVLYTKMTYIWHSDNTACTGMGCNDANIHNIYRKSLLAVSSHVHQTNM